jgi:MSHA pilin protein MshA
MRSSINVKANQQGFTLIELVVVIVILGILAVTAAPKFINLQDDARTATLQAVKASMQSASALLYSKSLIKGVEKTTATAGVFVLVNGVEVNTHFGYPLANYGSAPATAAGTWADLIDAAADFNSTVIATGELVYYPGNVATAPTLITDTCIVYYTEAANAATIPTYTVVDCV